MRISTDRADAEGYQNYRLFFVDRPEYLRPRILLNGVVQQRVTMADEENGEIERIVVDERGRMKLARGDIVRERVYGKVKFAMRRGRNK